MGLAAEKIEENQSVSRPKTVKQPIHFLDEKFFGKTKREAVLETGELFALVLVLFAAARQYFGRPVEDALIFMLIAFLQYEVSLRAPALFYPIWKAWMGLGAILEMTVSKVILVASWILMVVPIGLLLKIIGKSTMNTAWKENCATYWEDKAPQDFKFLERQF